MVGIIALVLLIGIITLMVKGIIGIVHRFSKQEDEVVEIVAETECYTPSPSPTPTPEKMLADAEGNSDGPAYIHGKEVFSGYSVDTTSSKFINNDEQMMSTYAALIDASTGKLIASKSACERMYPASMTKILTALVAAEHITEENLDDEVEITSDDIYFVYKHDLSAV